MKNPLVVVAALALGFILAFGCSAKMESWEQRPYDATGALYVVEQNKHVFHCTVENVAIDGKDMIATTARHCVWHDASNGDTFFGGDPTPAGWDYAPLAVSYSADDSAPFFDAVPVQISTTDDIAVIRVKGAAPQAAVAIDKNSLVPGETVVNYGYPLDLGKLRFELQIIWPGIPHVPDDVMAEIPEWSHGMLISGTIAPGQSGSGIYDSKTHALAGIIVGHTSDAPTLGVAEPANRILRLLDGRDALGYSEPKPAPEQKQ